MGQDLEYQDECSRASQGRQDYPQGKGGGQDRGVLRHRKTEDGELKDQRGFALVITLLITALLVALSAEFADEVFVDTSARQNFTDGQQASIMAESGITACVKGLQFFQSGHSTYT